MSLLKVTGISLRETEQYVLKDISFTQQAGQKIALAGETGAGKSTLLQIIAGLVQPTAGEVHFGGRRVKGPAEQLMPGNPGISYLSQHYELPKFLRVEQVLKYANKLSAAAAQRLFEVCRIDHLGPHRTDHLSGGERQRVALTKLLLGSPKLLLLDEPFSNLDRMHKLTLKAVIQDIGEQLGITCILISHDPQDTLSWADQLLVLRGGQMQQLGSPRQVYSQPASEYVAGLFGGYTLLSDLQDISALGANRPARPGQKAVVRPESFTLHKAGKKGAPGVVKTVQFYGSYSEIEVALSRSTITVRTSAPALAPGEKVAVSLTSDAVWYV